MERLLNEIWQSDINWQLANDSVHGIVMYNEKLKLAEFGKTIEDVIRRVWLSIYSTGIVEVLPASYGVVKG